MGEYTITNQLTTATYREGSRTEFPFMRIPKEECMAPDAGAIWTLKKLSVPPS